MDLELGFLGTTAFGWLSKVGSLFRSPTSHRALVKKKDPKRNSTLESYPFDVLLSAYKEKKRTKA